MPSPYRKALCIAAFASVAAFGFFAFIAAPQTISAQTSSDDLKAQISDTSARIEALEKEIAALSTNLNTTSKQAQTLKNALATLELSRTKLEKDLSLTTTKISKASLTLTELASDIVETEGKIVTSSKVVAQGIRNIQMADDQSTIQELLNQKTLSETWDYVNGLRSIHARVTAGLVNLRELRASLSSQKTNAEKEKANLVTLQKNLSGQKQAVEYSKTEQSKLLASTQNSAAAYQAQLAQKIKEKEAFEKELFEIESRLKISIDPSSVPDARSGIFSWPLSNVYITQSFGATVDSKRLYVSGTHNGVDFRAPVGTPVAAVLSGTVQATGNTDLQKSCYSYGKWVLLKHPNGLSSLYAHLSVIDVEAGETVATGDRIGYSGNTGYSTGPHLHLTVLASQGVRVQQYSSSINCKNTTIPLADIKAYLNPLSYLPSL